MTPSKNIQIKLIKSGIGRIKMIAEAAREKGLEI